ncbi:hypothetical protein PG989_007219 [Apiospora arundinis]
MATFTLFPRLAPELRDMIWKEALDEEADGRIVPVHRNRMLFRIMPFRCLISPLLSTNQESRKLALLRYNYKLDVVSVSSSDDITSEEVQEFASRRDENQWEITPIDDSIKQKYWDTVKASEYYYDTMRMLDFPLGDIGRKNGCLRLNLETDKSMLPYDIQCYSMKDSCAVYLTRDAKNKFLGSHPLETTVLRHNLTLEVPESARSRMRNIVCAAHRVPPPDPNSMGMWRLRSCLGFWLWKTHVFTQLNNPTSGRFLALFNPMPFNMCNEGDGLGILDTAAQEGAQGGVQSLTFTEWRREDDISDSWGWSLTGPFEV